MAAPKGNRFWEKRSKHGMDKLFKTPTIMWEAACEYFAYCQDNPLISVEYAAGRRVKVPKMQAFTIQGLCLFLHCNSVYFNTFERSLRNESGAFKSKKDEDFDKIITRIRETIYSQKFSGAAAGFFNANIIARDLGLSDKTESKTTPTVIHHTADLTSEQVTAYNKALEEDF